MNDPSKIDPGFYCQDCDCPGECDIGGCVYDNAEATATDDEPSDPDGECFRGGEWAAAQAAEADWIRRNLK